MSKIICDVCGTTYPETAREILDGLFGKNRSKKTKK
jgi:hypothetical protein